MHSWTLIWGDTNDFELQMALSEYMNQDIGDRIYLPGTEYGGPIEDKEHLDL